MQQTAYRQSNERTGKYSPDDWKRISEEASSIYKDLAGMMDLEPGDPAVQEAIGRWR
ncbi:MAG: TipAS antibiotic-recognition domain-containing protein [Clostridia bacterium]|nr:TipAS antibiotic-recognition domain-containing protein [Clostridia bacterium]